MEKLYKLMSSGIYPLLYPAVFYAIKKKRGYNLDIMDRFFPNCNKNYKILFHFASLGEARTLSPLLELWGEKLDNFLFESVTPTGRDQLIREVPSAEVKLFPLDYYPSVKRLLKKCNVEKVILFETELWPSIFTAAKELGIGIYIINGKFSSSTRKMFRLTHFFWKRAFQSIEGCYVVEADSRKFLLNYGIDEGKISIVPDVKYLSSFRESEIDDAVIDPIRNWANGAPVIVLGSMHRGEESILKGLKGLDYKIIYVPRHINWVQELKYRVEKMDFRVGIFSRKDFSSEDEVLLIDSYGLLSELYSVAKIAVIGGSFVAYGGHNPLEPLRFGVPVLFGQHMENFATIIQDILNAEVGKQITSLQLPEILKHIEEIFPSEKMVKGIDWLIKKKDLVEKAYLDFLEKLFDPF